MNEQNEFIIVDGIKRRAILQSRVYLKQAEDEKGCGVYRGVEIKDWIIDHARKPEWANQAIRSRTALTRMAYVAGTITNKDGYLLNEEERRRQTLDLAIKGRVECLTWKLPDSCLASFRFVATPRLFMGADTDLVPEERLVKFSKIIDQAFKSMGKIWKDETRMAVFLVNNQYWRDCQLDTTAIGQTRGTMRACEVLVEGKSDFSLILTVLHEGAHCLILEGREKKHPPEESLDSSRKRIEYLDDGICEYLANEAIFFPHHWYIKEVANYKKMIRSGEIVDDDKCQELRYAVGDSLCDYLIRKVEVEGLKKIQERVLNGSKITKGIMEETGLSWSMVAEEWLKTIKEEDYENRFST